MPARRRWRSAITGRFVAALYALTHPRTTVAERCPAGGGHEPSVLTVPPKCGKCGRTVA